MFSGGPCRSAELNSMNLQTYRLLCRVRMLLGEINFQALHHPLAKLVLRQHTEDGFADQLLRLGCKNLPGGNLFQSTGIQSVPPIDFFIEFFACEFYLLGINNDDMIAADEERDI